jgi:hypothetical protein
MNAHLDDIDGKLLEKYTDVRTRAAACRTEAWKKTRKPPYIGDFVIFKDGHSERIISLPGAFMVRDNEKRRHVKREGISTDYGNGSFHLTDSSVSHSGGLRHLDDVKLVNTGDKKPGTFWFFRHGQIAQGNAVEVEILCNVYRLEDTP